MATKNLNAQINIGGTVAKSLTKGLTDTRGQLRDVGAQIGKTTRRQQQLSKEIRQAEAAGESVAGLRNEYNKLDAQLGKLKKRQSVLRGMADVGQRFGTMSREVGKFGKRAGIVVGGLSASIFGLSNSTATLGDEVAKMSRQLGIGQTEFQELQYAAERNGVKNFSKNLDRFQKRIGEAAQGTGEARKAIEQLNVTAETLESLSPDEAIGVLADEMQGLETQEQRLAVASKLFGSEGREMVRMLEDGSAGLDELRKKAHTTGYILGNQATKDAESFKDSMTDATLSMKGLKNIIGAELMPVVASAMDRFTGYLADNRDEVEEFANVFATKVEAAIPVVMDLAKGLGSMASTMASVTGTLATLVGGFDNLGMIIGAAFAGKAIASIVMFGKAVVGLGGALSTLVGGLSAAAAGVKAVGLALAANPIGAIIAGIALAAGLIWTYWEPISGFVSELWEGVTNKVGQAFDFFKTVFRWSPLGLIMRGFGAAWNYLSSIDWSGVGGTIIDTLVSGIKSMAMAPVNAVKDTLGAVRQYLPFSDAKTGPLSDLTKSGASLPRTLAEGIEAGGDSMTERLGNVVGGAMRSLNNTITNNPVTQRVQQVLEPAASMASDLVPDGVRDFFGAGGDRPADPIPTVQGPGRASGERQASGESRSIQITNEINLQVSRGQGEDEGDYIRRLADRLMEELNDRQEGALFDG